jgi:hypothetical protein
MSLIGHLIPGTFFIIFGVWWSFGISVRFILSKQRSPFKKNETVGYRSTVTIPCICLASKRLRRMPLESMVKLFFATVGIIIEVSAGSRWQTMRIPMGQSSASTQETILTTLAPLDSPTTQHMHDHHGKRDVSAASSPANFFSIHYIGIENDYMQHITMYSGFLLGSVVEILMHYGYELPVGMDYACGAVAYTLEAFIFNSHLHGKGMVDAYMHVLLVW